MKNQYVGDIGDYTKLGLLRVLENSGLSIGVNWYCTPDDAINKDGRHIDYLESPCDTPDMELHSGLHSIVIDKQERTINALMNSGLLKNAVFYSTPLVLSPKSNPVKDRSEWHKEALLCLCSTDVVFVDPDNGFIADSVSPYSSKGNKYVTYEEAADYFNSGTTVIVYCHRDRSQEEKYVNRLHRIKDHTTGSMENLMCLKAHRYSSRDYFFIMQPAHHDKIKCAVDKMLATRWKNYLSYRII